MNDQAFTFVVKIHKGAILVQVAPLWISQPNNYNQSNNVGPDPDESDIFVLCTFFSFSLKKGRGFHFWAGKQWFCFAQKYGRIFLKNEQKMEKKGW